MHSAPTASGLSIRTILREAATSLDGLPARPERLVVVARLVLVAMLPFVMLPTGVSHIMHAPDGWQPGAAWSLTVVWWIATAVSLMCSGAVWALGGRGRASRWCILVALAALMTTNQMTMLGGGSMTSWGILYVVALVAAGRVAVDHGVGVFGVVFGIVGMTGGVMLEWSEIMPLAPLAPRPIVHPSYEDAPLAALTVLTANVAVLLTFFVVNYAMNQSLKLHRYITDGVLRRYLPPSMVKRASTGELRLDEAPKRRR